MKNRFLKLFKKEHDPLTNEERLKIIEKSSQLVGPGVFYSTVVIIVSFLPVFLLTGMEGKLFSPLAWTKSLILIVDAFLAITLTPVLISFLLKGKLKPENKNPINRKLEAIYTPILTFCLKWRKSVLAINIVALLIGGLMFTRRRFYIVYACNITRCF
jgi:copper/silver efflux system protein